MSKMKLNGKALGIDGRGTEMWKFDVEVIEDLLMRVCQAAGRAGTVPSKWTIAVIVAVHKGNDGREIRKYWRLGRQRDRQESRHPSTLRMKLITSLLDSVQKYLHAKEHSWSNTCKFLYFTRLFMY